MIGIVAVLSHIPNDRGSTLEDVEYVFFSALGRATSLVKDLVMGMVRACDRHSQICAGLEPLTGRVC